MVAACPAEWDEGTLKGVSLRGGICMNELAWKGNSCTVVLTSKVDQTITIGLRSGFPRSVTLKAGQPITIKF